MWFSRNTDLFKRKYNSTISLMDRDYQNKDFLLLFYLIFLVGIAGHFSEKYFKSMLEMTPVVLLLSGTATLAVFGKLKSK